MSRNNLRVLGGAAACGLMFVAAISAGGRADVGAQAPTSVGLAGPFAVVVDKADDANRSLDAIEPAYRTFRLEADGSLTPISAPFRVPPSSSLRVTRMYWSVHLSWRKYIVRWSSVPSPEAR